MSTQLSIELFSRKYLLLALAGLAALSLTVTACGGDSNASQDEIEAARQQGASKARQQAKINQIQKEIKALKHGKSSNAAAAAGASPAPEGGSAVSSGGNSGNCGASVSANEYTTCGFAENVQQAYFEEVGSGSGTVYAYSPTTNQTYAMYCTAGSPHECTGGNDAAVYFP